MATTLDLNALASLYSDQLGGGLNYVYGGPGRVRLARYDAFRAQWLYTIDSYAKKIINNIAQFAIGDGVDVDFGSDRLNRMWKYWKWNLTAPTADVFDLQKLAALSLVRDGDIFLWQRDGDCPAIDFIEPKFIWSGTSDNKYQAGIQVDKVGRPTNLIYNPAPMNTGAIAPTKDQPIPYDEVIHVFGLEWAGQARGMSWMIQATPWIELLREVDLTAVQATHMAIASRGFWTTPMDLMLEALEQAEELTDEANPPTDDARKKIIQTLMTRTDWNDLDKVRVLPEGYKWEDIPFSGVTDTQMIQNTRTFLLDRIAAGVGVSRQVVTDGVGRSLPVARVDVLQDYVFYKEVQRHMVKLMTLLVDWWAEKMYVTDMKFADKYDDFKLTPSPFPHLDTLREAQTNQVLVGLGAMSPPEIIRQRGGNVEQVQQDFENWATWQQSVYEKTGILPASSSVDFDSDDSDDRESENTRIKD